MCVWGGNARVNELCPDETGEDLSMVFPGAQIFLQAGSWEKLCEIRVISVAMASQWPQAMPDLLILVPCLPWPPAATSQGI